MREDNKIMTKKKKYPTEKQSKYIRDMMQSINEYWEKIYLIDFKPEKLILNNHSDELINSLHRFICIMQYDLSKIDSSSANLFIKDFETLKSYCEYSQEFLIDVSTWIDNAGVKLKKDMTLRCPECEFDYNHLIATIEVKSDEDYQINKILLNGNYVINCNARYEFSSQGNIHLLFNCEDGHFFIKSYDGHKGMIYVNENELMANLASYLNKKCRKENSAYLSLEDSLISMVNLFFYEYEKNKY